MNEWGTPIEIATLATAALAALLALLALLRARRPATDTTTPAVVEELLATERRLREEVERLRATLGEEARSQRGELSGNFESLRGHVRATLGDQQTAFTARLDGFEKVLKGTGEAQKAALDTMAERIATQARDGAAQFEALRGNMEQRLETMRTTVEQRLDRLRTENAEKLEAMRVTVDEKLQKTLHERLGASFEQVSKQLENVHRSVGEMQQLATGVGDLKRVLTNVKTRGTWGEVSLGALLADVLTIDQFAQNVPVDPKSNERVEYAICLPGDGDSKVWLPIDAKFPHEDYERLQAAADLADAAAVEAAAKQIELRIRQAARDIRTKYVCPPHSTDFGIMFLPTEGLFAEVVRRPGLVELLQREERVVVAGPTTLLSILSSLRMGFRTLAIQKRSSEVWQVLGAVKTEFGKFGGILDKVEKKLTEAQNAISDAGRRQRAVDRKLRTVEALDGPAATALLELPAAGEADEAE